QVGRKVFRRTEVDGVVHLHKPTERIYQRAVVAHPVGVDERAAGDGPAVDPAEDISPRRETGHNSLSRISSRAINSDDCRSAAIASPHPLADIRCNYREPREVNVGIAERA